MAIRIAEKAGVSRRRLARAPVGRLRDNRVTRKTLLRYINAVSSFRLWLLENNFGDARTWEDLDSQVGSFIESLWEEGGTKGTAGCCCSGIQHLLLTKRILPGAWSLLSTWGRLEIPARAPPMPWLVLRALVGVAKMQKRHALAAALLLAYHGFLRVTELLTIQKCHLTLSPQGGGVLCLPWTKSGQRRGAQELISITCPVITARLSEIVWQLHPLDRLVTFSAPQYRDWFRKCMDLLGLSNLKFQPYSIRRGGATHWYMESQSLESTLYRGRWSALSTGRIYITEGYSLLAQLSLSNEQVARLESTSRDA